MFAILLLLIVLGISYLITSGVVWVVCFALFHLGVNAHFSWWLSLIVWIVWLALASLFKRNKE